MWFFIIFATIWIVSIYLMLKQFKKHHRYYNRDFDTGDIMLILLAGICVGPLGTFYVYGQYYTPCL